MTNINENAALYSGSVEIKYVKPDKEYKVIKAHNNATPALLNYIINRMINNSTSVEKRPGFIDILNGNTSCLSKRMIYSDAIIDTEAHSVTFVFIVPNTFVKSNTYNKLVLYSYIGGESYAEVVFDTPHTIAENANVEVSWTLKLNQVIMEENN